MVGDFQDSSGGAGNVFTGEYTTSDGAVETASDIETPTSAATGTGFKATGGSTATGVTSCTTDVALPGTWDDGSNNSGLDAIIQAGADCAGVDAVGESSCSKKRALTGLECTASETCVLYGSTVLLCLDQGTGEL